MKKIEKFLFQWKERGYEKGEAQVFWLQFLRDVLEVPEPEKLIRFEVSIPNGFIDALIEDTNGKRLGVNERIGQRRIDSQRDFSQLITETFFRSKF